MTLSELRQAPHLSASSIGDYLDCGLLFKFGRIDKLKPEYKADALEYGSTIHRVLEEIFQNKMVGIDLTIKEIHESFEKHWTKATKDNQEIKYAEGNSFESLLLQGKELLTAYYHKRPNDGFNILAIEEAFSFTPEGMNIPIIGAYDLVLEDESGTIVIVDFKTSGRSYSIDEVDRNFQLTLYQIAAKENGYADRDIYLRFDCLIKTKTPKFEQYYTSRSEIDEKKAIRKIQEVSKAISKGVFIPNDSTSNWKCKGCSYKSACEDWFMNQEAA